jgi:Zn-dependent M28 family amino/carboxypeptidase
MKRHFFFFTALLFLLSFKLSAQEIDINRLKKHIYFLADDKMKGRATGSKELAKSAKYIEKEFKKYKLRPLGTKGYRQAFEAKVRRVIVPDSIRQAENIIGFLDNEAPYTIVVGAHYDHLGHGDFGGTRDTSHIGHIHNGADDNASGVAGLLELARYYSTNKVKEKFNILFIALSAEELGLVGSRYWTENPTLSLEKIHWMLNMDMIGRYNPDNGLAVIGYGTSSKFPAIFDGVTSSIKFNKSKDGNGGSDQTSFYKKNIPVLFFHTGGHDDYHKATDDADKIDYEALKAILELEIKVIDNSMLQDKMDFIWTN